MLQIVYCLVYRSMNKRVLRLAQVLHKSSDNLDFILEYRIDFSTISTSPPGIGLWLRSVNLTSHPRFFMLGRDRSSTHTRRDRRAHYFDVMQRYLIHGEIGDVFFGSRYVKPSIDVPNTCFIVLPRAA